MTREECYSVKCPEWIMIDEDAKSIVVDGRRNNNKLA